MDEKENWVTVATFNWLSEAQVLSSFLESAGIEVLIPESNIGHMDPMATAMQVRVQVRESSAEDAKKIFLELNPVRDVKKCIRCGKDNARINAVGFKGWLQFMLGVLTMVPLRSSRKRLCEACQKLEN